ncbi:MAG: hypothetical protein A2857_02020 [Candidatus Levybacteria bacterium RIFCSPHIGHO2_01_FULL_36_15]|nr:MAG: hypothetical protein A2857_02020 [Candidatus Levybacteria bacterium RIFCSPHIGHO2_01_FULL_36_15]
MKKPFAFLFIILASLIALSISAESVYAQSNTINPQLVVPETNPDVPQNLHTFAQSVTIEVLSAVSCQISGIGFTDNGRCLGVDIKTGKIGYVSGEYGAIGFVSSLIGKTTTNMNISSRDYYTYLFQNFGIAKPAYAQQGFIQLSPVMTLWQSMRNIAYLILVIIFIIIGLGIMLRIQVDPRTVMTIQNQIPKAIIGILLVTFSYAIVGYLIDLMWVSVYFLLRIFAVADPLIGTALQNSAAPVTGTPLDFVNQLFGMPSLNLPVFGIKTPALNIGGLLLAITASFTVGHVMQDFIQAALGSSIFGQALSEILIIVPTSLLKYVACIGSGWGITLAVPPSIKTPDFFFCARDATAFTAGIIGGLIAFLIFSIALLIALIRLWFALIKSFVFVFLDVIFAPLWIISGILPGVSGFGSWIRDVVANLSVFPTAIAMFLIAKVLMDGVITAGGTNNFFMPPLIGNVGGVDGPAIIASLLGLGIILMTPAAVTMVRDTLKAPTFKYIAAIGASIGAGAAVGNAGIDRGWYRLTRPYNYQTRQPAGPLRTFVVGRPDYKNDAGQIVKRGKWQGRIARLLGEAQEIPQ